MQINKEAFAKFADALDSGKYRQNYGILCDVDGYCVWGVATEIVHEDLGFTKVMKFDYAKYVKEYGGYVSEGSFVPPTEIMNHYFGEGSSDVKEHIFGTLLDMNDDRSHSFSEIASYIRKEILKED